jgi:hypothetical protein
MDVSMGAHWISQDENFQDGPYQTMMKDLTLFSRAAKDLDYTSDDLEGLLSKEAPFCTISLQDLTPGYVNMQVGGSGIYLSQADHSDASDALGMLLRDISVVYNTHTNSTLYSQRPHFTALLMEAVALCRALTMWGGLGLPNPSISPRPASTGTLIKPSKKAPS